MSLQSKTFLGVATFLLSMSLGATACDDPAEGKAKAKVEDADPKTEAEAEDNDAKANGKSDRETAAAATLTVDTEASKVEWVGSKVSGSHPGGFKKFSAKLSPKDGKAAGGNVSAEIDTTSLYSDSDKLTEHLMSADFFEVDAHPTAKFDSTSIAEGGSEGFDHTVEGTLTLHGTTKKITFPANIDMADNGAKVTSEFSINRKDFGMEYAGMADDLIRDDVVIKLDLVFP